MPGPFDNAIKTITGGAPGTGAFTPSTASAGFRPWSTQAAGWWGLVRYEDGADWELSYSYWNGTTLSRGTNQLEASSTGSVLNLTSSATAAMIPDGTQMSPLANLLAYWAAAPSATTVNPIHGGPTVTGTAGSITITASGGNFFTDQLRGQVASPTTANGQAGWGAGTNAYSYVSTASGRGGADMLAIWGPQQLPTGPRLFVGLSQLTWAAATTEPSAKTQFVGFIKDSTDTNIHFATNDGSGTATKTDTGIAMVAATSWFYTRVWVPPGRASVSGLIVRLDTGAIWRGNFTTDLIAEGRLHPNLYGALNGTNTGTAFNMHIQKLLMYGASS